MGISNRKDKKEYKTKASGTYDKMTITLQEKMSFFYENQRHFHCQHYQKLKPWVQDNIAILSISKYTHPFPQQLHISILLSQSKSGLQTRLRHRCGFNGWRRYCNCWYWLPRPLCTCFAFAVIAFFVTAQWPRVLALLVTFASDNHRTCTVHILGSGPTSNKRQYFHR